MLLSHKKPSIALLAAALWIGSPLARAAEFNVGRVFLDDGYDLKIVHNTLYVEDRHDRNVLSIPLEETGTDQVFYCEFSRALAFKIAPTSAGVPRHYFLQKGKSIELATPLAEEELLKQLRETSIDRSGVKWTLTRLVEGGPMPPSPWYRYFTPLAIPLGFVLPIPFLVLLTRYVKLLRHVRSLERDASGGQA